MWIKVCRLLPSVDYVNNRTGWLSVPEPVSPDAVQQLPPPSHFSFSNITTAADLHLMREIAGLPMTELSPRVVGASKGTQGKAVKMLGLDGTQ